MLMYSKCIATSTLGEGEPAFLPEVNNFLVDLMAFQDYCILELGCISDAFLKREA